MLISEEMVLALPEEVLRVILSLVDEDSTLEDVLAAPDVLVLEDSTEYEVLTTDENEALEASELRAEL